jgi:glycosyltransferase 2 family protein
MKHRARRGMSLLVAAAFGAALLYVSLRGIEWNQVGRIIAGADPASLGLASALGCVSLLLRALRWRVLLNAEAHVPAADAFWATAAGYFGNNFLPARGGELVRMHIIARQRAMKHAFVLATALFERVADAIVLIAISAIVTMTVASQPGWIDGAARTFGALGLFGAVALAVLPLLETPATKILLRLPMPDGIRRGLLHTLEHGLRGLRAFHDPARLGLFLAFTVLIWSLDAVATVVGAAALGLHMPAAAAFLLLAGLGLGSALPSTPGYVGIYQFVAVSVLGPFGFSRTSAIAYIVVAQALSYVVIGVWGGVGLIRYRRMRAAPSPGAASNQQGARSC